MQMNYGMMNQNYPNNMNMGMMNNNMIGANMNCMNMKSNGGMNANIR